MTIDFSMISVAEVSIFALHLGVMKIKICGLTNLDDALCGVDAGADYLGFVLYPDSPRGVTLETFAGVRCGLGEKVQVVAVMVNPTYDEAMAAVERGKANIVQIHGDVGFTVFDGFPTPIWRGIAASSSGAIPDPAHWPADRYVVDAAVRGKHGGTGVLADWEIAAALSREYPVMLAGGLKPENVEEAIRHVAPLGVDVSSGIESRPGKKDHCALHAFVQKAREMHT